MNRILSFDEQIEVIEALDDIISVIELSENNSINSNCNNNCALIEKEDELEEEEEETQTALLPFADEEESLDKYPDVINLTSVFTKTFGSIKKLKKSKADPMLRPNYFFCIRIFNKQIIEAVETAQKNILQSHVKYKKAMIQAHSLHITLFTMSLKHTDQLAYVNELLQQYKEKNKSNDALSKFSLNFKGLSTFRNEVVYVDMLKNSNYDYLKTLQKSLVKEVSKTGIYLTETQFTPHMTLMKLSKMKNLKKLGIKKIDPQIYAHMRDYEFGEELVHDIYLCSIHKKQEDGFYNIEGGLNLQEKSTTIVQS